MIIYIFFFLVVFALLRFQQIQKVRGLNFYALAYSLIFLFCALRFDVGFDYAYYFELLTKQADFYEDKFARIEYINQLLIGISQKIGLPQFYFILTSFIIVICTYKTLKRDSKDFVISSLVFLSFPIFFLNSLSIIRQYVAVCIVFYGFKFIKKRKLVPYLAIIGVAFLFHRSAVIAVVLYWLYHRKIENIYYVIIYFAGLFSSKLAYLVVAYIFPQYLQYLDRRIGTGGDKVLLFFQLIGLVLLLLVNRKKTAYENYNFYMTSFFVGLFIWSSLSPYGHAGFRGALYFMVFFMLLLPEILDLIKERKVLKQMVYYMSFVFFIFSLWLGTKNETKDPNIPYRVFFLTDTTIYKE
ncbi:EpsG family protein [Spongiimicrobium salis]|uniref:EpsG family protein n=1 Tax=Spongiimicrobium salis TaxID=1667022 RepID=UPI00374DE92D